MDQIYDVIIIGGGAAATSAAMTLKNRGKTLQLFQTRSKPAASTKRKRSPTIRVSLR